jgi:ribosome maturation factor RimP
MSMLDEKLGQQVKEIVEPVVRDNFLELFDFSLRRQGRRLVVSLVLDKKEGDVSLDECEAVSRDVEKRLDALDPIEGPYLLEVSSPGLDRPLRGGEDYRRFKGKLAQLNLSTPLEGQSCLRGRLGEAGEADVELRLEGGKDVRVPYSNVKSARLVVEM